MRTGLFLAMMLASLSGFADDPETVSAARLAGASPVGAVTAARIMKADREPGNWLAHGRTYDEQRFSPLDSINRESVR
ncbi:MAG: PQQ-dependent dehydrogenase, methanol/ethanol family, partial [Halioglobus sp.]